MRNDLVSIIVPCYNGEQFIDRCFCSIILQSYRPLEVIIVDDGSIDDSKKRALSWEKKLSDTGVILKYIFQNNKGPAGAINTGLQNVEGKYLSLLDVDDEYLTGCIEERVRFLENNPQMDVVRTNGYVINKNNKYLFVQDRKKEPQNVFRGLLRGETNNWAGSYMLRTSALFDYYPERVIYPSRFGQNLQILLPLVYNRKSGFIDRPHMNYIQQEQSLSQTSDLKVKKARSLMNAEGYLDIRLHMINEIVKDNSEKEMYVRDIYEGYWTGIMRLADCFHDPGLMESAYNELLRYKRPDINDKLLYYGVCKKVYWYLFRFLRKCGLK